MPTKVCPNGHTFEKTSDCPVCPICSGQEMRAQFGTEFPNLGAPAFRAIASVDVKSLRDLTKFSEKELLALHGFGPRGLRLLKDALAAKKLRFSKKQ